MKLTDLARDLLDPLPEVAGRDEAMVLQPLDLAVEEPPLDSHSWSGDINRG